MEGISGVLKNIMTLPSCSLYEEHDFTSISHVVDVLKGDALCLYVECSRCEGVIRLYVDLDQDYE